ncbi:MAG TPA: c-type cytochrome [Fluviicola sp.]|nr:c-type cytochrome [Fluviicola sp.]
MKKQVIVGLLFGGVFLFAACGGGKTEAQTEEAPKAESMVEKPADYDPKRGEGKFDETNLKIEGLDDALATKGASISETKCFSCHKTTDEKLVGPGWNGVTTRHTPHWIMNFITNPDPMIDKDPKLQEQLELCLVRMPNQNLTEDEARSVLEFMRKNDGAK